MYEYINKSLSTFLAGALTGIVSAWCINRFSKRWYKEKSTASKNDDSTPKDLDEPFPLTELHPQVHTPISPTPATSHEKQPDVPDNAPEHCPGVQSENAGQSSACDGCPNKKLCASGEAKQSDPAVFEVKSKLAEVRHKIVVLSGKGGVGKSTVASQLAWALHDRGFDVGLLDIDICGPSIPQMTGTTGSEVHQSALGWSPVYVDDRLAVMSIGFLLPDNDAAIIWRGPKKNGLIRQFLTDVMWGSLDFLIIDSPPGTSDEHLSVVSYLSEAGIDGSIVVTTPQEVALTDVRKEINFCKKVQIQVLGVVENMAGSVFEPSSRECAEEMSKSMEVPYSGKLQMESALFRACENGQSVVKCYPDSSASNSLNDIVNNLLTLLGEAFECNRDE